MKAKRKPRKHPRRNDEPQPSDGHDWSKPTRDGLPDSIEEIGEDWLWSNSVSVFHDHHTIAEPSVRDVLDRYPWRVRPDHGDGPEAKRLLYQHQASEDRASRCGSLQGYNRGSLNPAAKLTEEDVRRMRDAFRGGVSITDLSVSAGVTYSAARAAVMGKTWRHIGNRGDGSDRPSSMIEIPTGTDWKSKLTPEQREVLGVDDIHRFAVRRRIRHEADPERLSFRRDIGSTMRKLANKLHPEARGSQQALAATIREIVVDATVPLCLRTKRSFRRR